MSRLWISLITALLLVVGLAAPAQAQSVEYRIDLDRNFGYGNGSNVRGDFTNSIYSEGGTAENIASVTYRIDGQTMAMINEAPFEFRYNTDSYPSGVHVIDAVVTTKDGREVTTPPVQVNFLSSAEQNTSMQRIFIPVFTGILIAFGIAVAVQLLVLRRNPKQLAPGVPRSYGFKGGTICPRCDRPYAIHFWSINLGLHHLDRCDYCGKVALVTRKHPDLLAAAEMAELAAARANEGSLPGAENGQSEEDRLRKMLDDSRFQE